MHAMERRSGCGRPLLLVFVGLLGLCVIGGIFFWESQLKGLLPRPLPVFPTRSSYAPWPTPPVATTFDYPLLPAEDYGPLASWFLSTNQKRGVGAPNTVHEGGCSP